MKPRVLIFRSELLPRSETFIAEQARALRRYKPVFAGLRRVAQSQSLPPELVLPFGIGSLGRLVSRQTGLTTGLAARARVHQAALLHAHFAIDAAEAMPLQRALRLPLVVTLHGYDVMCSDATHRETRRGRLYLARREELWARASVFVCVSHAVRQRALSRGFPGEKLRVLPIGVDTGELEYVENGRAAPHILFVGRLVEKKGCRVLLQAMALVQQKLPRMRLLIAGDGPARASLERLALELTEGTRFLGVQSPGQVRALMRDARCLAAPSQTAQNGDAEGLPMVLCEALALGLPVASTRHSGIPELIRHREHGLLSAEGDPIELAQHLVELCRESEFASALSRGGRARVEQSFDLARQTLALEEIYDEVVEERNVAGRGVIASLAASGEEPADRVGVPAEAGPGVDAGGRLRTQAAWLLSGSGAAMLLQALYFLLIGRLLGSREYGAFVGVVALVNVLSQFSSLGMEMVLLRTIARDRLAFAVTWYRALVVSGLGFAVLLAGAMLYGHLFLSPSLVRLLPWLAISDAFFGKVTQLGSRALQGAGMVRWSAKLPVLTNAVRAGAAGVLFGWAAHGGGHVSVLLWVRTYAGASFAVALVSFGLVTRRLGWPRRARLTRAHLAEGVSFSFSSSAISVYNDIDKTLLVSHGMLLAAGIYGAAYRIVDVVSVPIVSLFGAASPRLFRQGAREGPTGAARGAQGLLRWAVPFGLAAAPLLVLCAPAVPRLFGHSFAGSVTVLRWLCLLPLLRGLHYAWGTAITACASQWWRTATQAGVALLNLLLNLWLIPRYGWHGAAVASLLSDGGLALATFAVLRVLVQRNGRSLQGSIAGRGALQCTE
jgi:glycosyltransferase involved in cell wall biosynthesis/O-antigen/teichoic acid export membrane protein